jgi:hypothetical protein
LLDSAVVEFLTTTAEGLIERAILQYHVFAGILTSTILVDGFVQTLRAASRSEHWGHQCSTKRSAVKVDILANNGAAQD